MSTYTFSAGSPAKTMVGTPSWNSNGSLKSLAITDGFNSGGTQTCKYGDPSTSVPGYDDLGRLIKVDCGATVWQQNFSYDAFGNLTKSVPTGGTGIAWNPGYNSTNNHYTLGGTSYDANGNLLTDTFHTYTWDADGHPATIDSSTCGTNGTCVTYDALGRPVEKNVHGVYSQILYSQLGKTAVLNGTTLVYVNIPLPGGAIYHLTPGYGALRHKDWQGTTRLETTINNRSSRYDRAFAPFGEVYLNFGGTDDNDFAGNTQELVPGTDTAGAVVAGLYDTANREYHPNQGRWLSPDPAGLQAVDPSNPQNRNRYVYGLNSPLSNIDPSGLECVWDDGSFDAADDPKTGSADGCSGQGGTWVDPDLFENAMLTSGQWSSSYGDWSSSANSDLAQNWIGGSTVFGGPLDQSPTSTAQNGGILNGIGSSITDWFHKAQFLGVGGSLWIPHPEIPVGWSPGVNFVSDGKDLHFCPSVLAGGVGVKTPGGSVAALFGDKSKAVSVVQGWSVTINVNFPQLGGFGGQIISSSTGTLAGPSWGSPGISFQVGYSSCTQR